VLVLAISVPLSAGDPAGKQAKNDMKWGVDAAKHGYWLEALNRFQRVNQVMPDRSHVLNNIAVALEASGQFEDALLTYETALAIAPNDRVLRRNYSQFKEFYDSHVAPVVSVEEAEESEETNTDDTDEKAAGSTNDEQKSR
jgi:tetratricopeptide (TPR) repeat protein